MESLKEKTAKGLFWGGLNNGMMQLIGLAFGILLGRLLDKSDFGMMAAISIFSLIATTLQDSGFKTALVNQKDVNDRDYNSVFWFNITVGISMYIILFLCAPLIGDFYNNDKIVPLCRYAFLSIVIASFSTTQGAYLFKNLRAKQQAKASMTAVLLSSIVGVTMAYMGMAYWSLATQGVVFVLMNTIMTWHYSPWRPHFAWDFEPVRRMFRFSCKILATSITTQINNNVLNILSVRFFGVRTAGVYSQAYQWNFKAFSLVQGMVNQVAQPVLVDLNEESDRQLGALRKMMRFTAFISFPLLLGLALVAREFIVIAITAKWLPSVELLQLLCISGAVMPLSTLLSNMIITKGRSDIYFYCTLALCVVQIVTMIFIWSYGIHTMVVAYVVLNVMWLLVWHFFTKQMTGYGLWMFFKDTIPFALAAAGVMTVTYLATTSIINLWLLLVTRVIVAAILYFVIMKVARVKILDECIAFVLRKDKK